MSVAIANEQVNPAVIVQIQAINQLDSSLGRNIDVGTPIFKMPLSKNLRSHSVSKSQTGVGRARSWSGGIQVTKEPFPVSVSFSYETPNCLLELAPRHIKEPLNAGLNCFPAHGIVNLPTTHDVMREMNTSPCVLSAGLYKGHRFPAEIIRDQRGMFKIHSAGYVLKEGERVSVASSPYDGRRPKPGLSRRSALPSPWRGPALGRCEKIWTEV